MSTSQWQKSASRGAARVRQVIIELISKEMTNLGLLCRVATICRVCNGPRCELQRGIRKWQGVGVGSRCSAGCVVRQTPKFEEITCLHYAARNIECVFIRDCGRRVWDRGRERTRTSQLVCQRRIRCRVHEMKWHLPGQKQEYLRV